MSNEEKKENFKAPDNEDYDVNNPQNIAQPAFSSDTDKRNTDDLPGIENLNQQNDENNQLHKDETSNKPGMDTNNDESLTGEAHDTDLGNSTENDDSEDDKLIKR